MKGKNAHIDESYLLTPKEVKAILRISLATVYNLVERGQLRAVIWEAPGKNGRKSQRTIRLKREDVFAFIEENYS